jgi:hypothetical protein
VVVPKLGCSSPICVFGGPEGQSVSATVEY